MDAGPGIVPRAQRALSATWRLAVLGVVIAGLALVLAHSLRVYFAQSQEIAAVKVDIAVKQEQIAELEDKLNRWEDPQYVRSVARVRLGWVMPGEVGYRVIDADGRVLNGSEDIEGVGSSERSDLEARWWDKLAGSVRVVDEPVAARR